MSETIVIADDDRDMRRGLEFRAKKWGYDVIPVDDGERACELLIPKDGPNLAILDRHMPGADGVAVCERVRSARPRSDVFLMMLTGRDAAEDVAGALDSGANDYVTKPYNDVVLKARLDAGSQSIQATSTALARIEPTEPPETVLSRVLHDQHLVPEFDTKSMTYGFGALSSQVNDWQKDGGLSPVIMDRVKTCPDCNGLPTFRDGCPKCGSGQVQENQMLHHFRCGHVDTRAAFQSSNGLECPKCLTSDMIVGVDFEHVSGIQSCGNCHWSGDKLDLVGQCTQCGLRFPGADAVNSELVGYHVKRLGVLAEFAAH